MSEKNLYQELAAQVGAPNSPVMPKIFAALINDTEARVLLAASPLPPLRSWRKRQVSPRARLAK